MRVCRGCAGENDDTSIFCATCGEILDWDPSAAATHSPDAARFPPPNPSTVVDLPRPAPPPPFAPPAAAETELAPLPEPEPEPEPAEGSISAAIEIAERVGRDDLASQLRANREQIRRTGVTVAVVGEFKKGKSSLVNALVNAEVCPSDAVHGTVAPIVVRHGDALAVTIERKGHPPATVDLADAAVFGSESGNEANHFGVTHIEITVARRLLASGLVIVDTPGVGGLESAAGALNLAILEQVDGVLFVTDCSQELTAPELAFLTAARERCSAVVCVMSKVDLHLSAAVLADRNRRHLDAAGLHDVQVLAVSSLLHLVSQAQGDAQLEEESGFGRLFDAIHTTIWEPARIRDLADAGQQLADLADHLAMPIEAARVARGSEQAAQQTIARLTEAGDRVRQFRSSAAPWRRSLADGTENASVDLDHDLTTRMRSLARIVEGRVDADDPVDDLVFEAWLHKLTIEEVVAHYRLITDRANALADEVGQHFATLDPHVAFQVDVSMPDDLLATVHVNREQRLLKDGVARRIVPTGQGYRSGLFVTSVVGAVNALPWISLLGLPFAGSMARRALSDDRLQRRAAVGQELTRLAMRYLDEIGLIVREDSRHTIGRIEREIGERYAARVEQVELTLQHAMASAEHAYGAPRPAPASTDLDDRATIREVVLVAHQLLAGAAIAT